MQWSTLGSGGVALFPSNIDENLFYGADNWVAFYNLHILEAFKLKKTFNSHTASGNRTVVRPLSITTKLNLTKYLPNEIRIPLFLAKK